MHIVNSLTIFAASVAWAKDCVRFLRGHKSTFCRLK